MPKNSWILAASQLLLWGSCGFAASGGRYTVDTPWTTDEGLPQNSVLTITQTRDGYLWLGTISGLVRFDGVRFTVYDESNTPQLRSGPIVKLFEDSQTNLWVCTELGGVLRVNTEGKVTSLDIGRGSRATRVASAVEDVQQAVWLYTVNGQLCRYKEQRVDVWEVGGSTPSVRRMLAMDTSGSLLWIATDWSLFALAPSSASGSQQLQFVHQIAVPGRVDFLFASPQGGFWLFSGGHVQKCSTNDIEKDFGAYPWGGNVIVAAACEDGEGNLFVGTYGDPGDGVYRFARDGVVQKVPGLSRSSILSLVADREGSIWVGTDGDGLIRLRPQYFDVVEGSRGLTVQSVTEGSSEKIWFGINGGGIRRLEGNDLTEFREREGVTSPYVRAVLADRDGRLWAGTYGGGLLRFQDGRFVSVPGFNVINQQVSALHQDSRGNIWVGTQGGVARWDGRNWRTFSTLDGLSGNSVLAVLDDAEGNLWVGTAGAGLNRISEGKVTTYGRTNGLPSETISALHLDSQSTLWVGTSSGLARHRQGTWKSITASDGLAGNSIRFLVEDGHGFLWIGSNGGLMRVSRQALNNFADGKTNVVPVRTFRKADGLPASECSPGSQPAACRSRGGRLWFPTIRGLAFLEPTQLQLNTNPPPVVIDAVFIDRALLGRAGVRAPVPRMVTVPSRKEILEIHFACLSLSAPGKGRWEYRLENHESRWTAGEGNSGIARYTRLPPGDYRFRVRACNEDDIWNEAGTNLGVTVLPPFWRTWWFLTLSTLSLLAAVIGSVHYVSTQKLQRQLMTMRQKEALENERARIARDLHDQLGANLTQVALLGEMAESDKDTPGEVEAHARQISHTARETTRALDEIVWTVNPSNDTVEGLVNYLCKYAQEFFALAGLKYRLDVPSQLPNTSISPELRHNVFLAAKEAVNNVVKHSQASSAWLRLILQPEHFVVEIEDDGRGLEAGDDAKGRSGLKNMRRRMEDIGGEFSVTKGQRGGVLVRLSAPLANSSPAAQDGSA